MFKLRLLGSFESNFNDRTVQFRTDKIRALMAYLAVEGSVPLSKHSLATLLWGNTDDKNARTNLRVSFHRVRQAIDKQAATPISQSLFESNRQSIQFIYDEEANQFWCDALLFERLLKSCETHAHQDIRFCSPCMARLEQAIALYQGDFLHGILVDDSEMFDEWLLVQREHYHQHAITALNNLVEGHLAQNNIEELRRFGNQLLALEPWHEAVHQQMMKGLMIDGKWEAALAQYELCRQSLMEELGVEPSEETAVLYQQILNKQLVEPPSPSIQKTAKTEVDTAKHNLPHSTTPYFGREKEQRTLKQHLFNPDSRLVTVVAEGGMGKSRLSLEVGRQLVAGFADGVWFVPLAGLASSEDEETAQDVIATAIAQALNHPLTGSLSPSKQIINVLKSKHLLLILDNFEHLMEGSTLLVPILQETTAVSMLCTSREPLNFMAENVINLLPLSVPHLQTGRDNGSTLSPIDYSGYASVKLFEERARRTTGWFELTKENQADVVTICNLVAGNPLGIELTAASIRQRSLADTIAAIKTSLDAVVTRFRDVPKRHRSMRAVFESSWELLSDEMKRLLGQLSVFRGGFVIEAVTAVTDATQTQLHILQKQSLLTQEENRFGMHELLRQFAEEKLADGQTLRVSEKLFDLNGTQDPKGLIEDKHSYFYLTFLADRTQLIAGEAPQIPAGEITTELDNIQQAWRVASENQRADLILDSLGTLADYLQLRGRYREAERLFGEAVFAFDEDDSKTAVTATARLMVQKTAALVRLSRYDEAITHAQASLDKAEQANDPWAQGYAHLHWGEALWRQGENEKSHEHISRVIQHAQTHELKRLEGSGFFHQNIIYYYFNDYIPAKESVISALEIWEILKNNKQKAYSMNSLGLIHFQLGNLDESRITFEETLQISEVIGDLQAKVSALNNLSMISTEAKDFLSADKYLKQSLLISKASGDKSSEVIARLSLGWNSFKAGEFKEARESLLLALNLAKEIKSLREEGLVLKMLGDLDSEEKDLENARINYQEAFLIAESLKDKLLSNEIQESRKKNLVV